MRIQHALLTYILCIMEWFIFLMIFLKTLINSYTKHLTLIMLIKVGIHAPYKSVELWRC